MNSIFYEKSIAVILENQHEHGGYIACPNFKQYQYYWFRDGSFIAYAMDIAGQLNSSQRFHQWAVQTILRNKAKIMAAAEKVKGGEMASITDFLHCRFNANGSDAEGDWAYHQLDGIGSWLWSFSQHFRLSGRTHLTAPEDEAISLACLYLQALWNTPCYDCWEENGNAIHTYTLAAIYGGFHEINKIKPLENGIASSQQIQEFIFQNQFQDGVFRKSSKDHGVDANLLGLVFPFKLIEPNSTLFEKTLQAIEVDLLTSQYGLHRYSDDSYYGGGEWILLSAWLGCVYMIQHKVAQAIEILAWVESQITPKGYLPEQSGAGFSNARCFHFWMKKWGTIASPLLWSHAMYIILYQSIKQYHDTMGLRLENKPHIINRR
ncbi:MAG TPA: glycoside hydrolase family 15 protein [Anaerolineaceae bacterium]|nr:glycoside hydrolase family 15 protein [Anaerolineaceae bacterium]